MQDKTKSLCRSLSLMQACSVRDTGIVHELRSRVGGSGGLPVLVLARASPHRVEPPIIAGNFLLGTMEPDHRAPAQGGGGARLDLQHV